MHVHQNYLRFEPSISRRGLSLAAGVFWILGSMSLLFRAYTIIGLPTTGQLPILLFGVIFGVLKSRFVLLKMARKNIERIQLMSPHKEKLCIFAFLPPSTFLIILIMIGVGIALRSYFPHHVYLAALYLGISLALFSSGIVSLLHANRIEQR